MADEIKELFSELLENREDLMINGVRLELDTIIEMKKLIELKEIQRHLFETACNSKTSSGSIDDIHSMLYKMKEKM
tara:strand:+ start:366 stop:593 length:228 start_codon:yes stop_codon:yes gene_type:complete